MKRLSRYKTRILGFLVTYLIWISAGTCAMALWGDYYRVPALVAAGLVVLYIMANNWIPDPERTPGYYWVMFDRWGDGPVWLPGEFLADGRWCYLGGPWSIREDELVAIGKRIEP